MVYLLHFDRPYRHAQHYLGYCEEDGLTERLARHASGQGARLLQVITAEGIGFRIARVWPGKDRKFERSKKGRGLTPLCPICRGKSDAIT